MISHRFYFISLQFDSQLQIKKMQNRELCWGRRAVERFTVDKESQIEALRQIGIDVALYQELEKKAAIEVIATTLICHNPLPWLLG